MRVKLENKVTKQQLKTVTVRDELHALKCDACEKIFDMREWCNEHDRAKLQGTFSDSPQEPDTGRRLGNGFSAHVCSFQCAHVIFTGGWRKMPDYKIYADADIKLARAQLVITSDVVDEKTLRDEWEKSQPKYTFVDVNY